MESFKISFNSKQKHLEEIAEWEIDSVKTPIKNSGNWSSIIDAFENRSLVIATHKDETVGFYTLSVLDLTISIGIAEVKSNFRRKGIAKLILEDVIKKYEKKHYALYLFCAPESSHKIWKKLGFKYFPNNSTNTRSNSIEMYRIIQPILRSKKNNKENKNEIIEIWNDEPYKTNDINPTWSWNIKYQKKTKFLKKPIVHFGHYEWRIRWRKGNQIYKDCKYKYFDIKNEIFNCMIIKKMPRKNRIIS